MKKSTLASLSIMSAMSLSAPAVADTGWTGGYGGLSVGYEDVSIKNDGYTMSYYGIPGTPDPSSAIGGAFGGFNVQAPGSNYVFGWEASLDLGGREDSTGPGGAGFGAKAKITGTASVKGRVGYTGHAGLMPWIDAGFAAGRTNYEVTYTSPISGNHGTQTAFGYTAGLGVDYAFRGPLFARASYSYTHLAKKTFWLDQPGESFDLNDFKFGIGYRF